MAQDIITVAGAGTWTAPANLAGTVQVEGWGGGGGGGGEQGATGAGGGGGGGYSKLNAFAATPGNGYGYIVGAGGIAGASGLNGGPGSDTSFNTSSLVAKTGSGGASTGATGGAGGAASGGTGDVKFSGAIGGAGSGATGSGGGGGSSAGTAADGNAGTVGGASGGAGGTAPAGGSAGGPGGNNGSTGTNGAGFGAGGGGSGQGHSGLAGGAGIAGKLIFTYSTASVPVADFAGTPTVGVAPMVVTFTDASTNAPTSWAWTFGDGATSSSQNPSHTYTVPGVYTVGLTATNAAGSNLLTRTLYITAAPAGGLTARVKIGLARDHRRPRSLR